MWDLENESDTNQHNWYQDFSGYGQEPFPAILVIDVLEKPSLPEIVHPFCTVLSQNQLFFLFCTALRYLYDFTVNVLPDTCHEFTASPNNPFDTDGLILPVGFEFYSMHSMAPKPSVFFRNSYSTFGNSNIHVGIRALLKTLLQPAGI